MLTEPRIEKLTAMRFLGMVEALKAQEQDTAMRELSFLERLGLLVDQQWSWRENQALARRLHAAKLKGASVEDIDYRTSRGLDKSVIRALAQKSSWVEQHENIFVLGPRGCTCVTEAGSRPQLVLRLPRRERRRIRSAAEPGVRVLQPSFVTS
jgi:DNA replication protein DnaC